MNILKKLTVPLIQGSFLLTMAGVISRIIGFFYRIFLSRAIGAEGLGLYHLVFPIMGLCMSLSCSGLQTAISRYTAIEQAKGNEKGCRSYLLSGILLSCTVSLILLFTIRQNSVFLAEKVLNEARCAPLLSAMTACLIPSCIHACINGYYYGKKKALLPSITQICEQLTRVGGVYLIYLIRQSENRTLTPTDAIIGIIIGQLAGMLISVTAVGFSKFEPHLLQNTGNLVTMAIPLTANRVIVSLCVSLENVLIPRQLQLFGYSPQKALGIFGVLTGMAMPVVLFPNVLSNSISVLLLPAISEAYAKKNLPAIRKAISKAIEYGLILGMSFTFLFLVTGKYIGSTLYHNELAGTYIRILCWICPFLYVSALLSSILHGLGYARVTLRISILGCLLRILVVWFLIPVYGIRAYLFSMLLSQMVCSLCAVWVLVRRFFSEEKTGAEAPAG